MALSSALLDLELSQRSVGRETVADRVKRLQAEARLLAWEEVETLEHQLLQIAAAAVAIAEGGEAYPVGARAIAQQYADDMHNRVRSMRAIMQKVADGSAGGAARSGGAELSAPSNPSL